MNLWLGLAARLESETSVWLNRHWAQPKTHIGTGRETCLRSRSSAAYAFHIAESQAFVDGNKRTASAAAISFLTLNGVSFPKDDGSVYSAMIEIAEKRMDKTGLANALRRLTRTTK